MNLAAEMARLPEPPNNSKPPLWNAWRHDLWVRAQKDEPQNFHRWPAVFHTMLVEHWWPAVMQTEVDYVWDRLNPDAIFPDTNPPNSHNLIHQAYHILRWQEATGLRIAGMQSIYEFGGGYGAMALVCNRLGFRGKYYIYDLPEFALLQQWYLGECGVGNVERLNNRQFGDVDLFIACYSLSETDFKERDRFLSGICAKSYLFLYSNVFEQYDNIDYFQNQNRGKTWQHSHIEHLPPESWYSFGW